MCTYHSHNPFQCYDYMLLIMGLSRVEKKFFGKNFCMMFEMLQASGDWSDAIMLLSGT